MEIDYSMCDHCHHRSNDHKSTGKRKCKVRGCTCPGFKAHGS